MTLLTQTEIASDKGASWQSDAYNELKERLSPPSPFPCTFSQNAFRRELLYFSFVETADQSSLDKAADDLGKYVNDCRRWDGRVATARPLLVVFSSEAAGFDTVEQYHDFGWRVLQHFHNVDPCSWPDEVVTKPEAKFWSFCFAGMQLFINMSAPLHHQRKSRNLGRYFTLVINPRERFDIVAGETREGRRVRKKIRDRVANYDHQNHSPLLGSYQKGELEWVQYALSDTNKAALKKCPFQFRGRSN